eukprot:gnl/TRDRNA2_/TRDRNA2_6243_c0_seq1.p1 gnl/TRDRNA2_/TRDRNA2_6243_c0~~gnl/TRDRNA2_/TRDRNA2_6243_c0_seq1.p1  ORF type:complete len:110 (-),score=7.11 gnl/TRDRNA2_/TRDRNA2_6243_c0_seq1:12-341(-)
MSVGFALLFSGFNAVQVLQSSMNRTLGYTSLAANYAATSISAPFAPKALHWIELHLSQRWQAVTSRWNLGAVHSDWDVGRAICSHTVDRTERDPGSLRIPRCSRWRHCI